MFSISYLSQTYATTGVHHADYHTSSAPPLHTWPSCWRRESSLWHACGSTLSSVCALMRLWLFPARPTPRLAEHKCPALSSGRRRPRPDKYQSRSRQPRRPRSDRNANRPLLNPTISQTVSPPHSSLINSKLTNQGSKRPTVPDSSMALVAVFLGSLY